MPQLRRRVAGWGTVAGSILLALAGLNAFLAARAVRRNPPEGAFVEMDGTRLHYLVLGKGPPLVMLHGNGSMIADFLASDLVTALVKKHTVYLFDRPGYGHTEGGYGRWTAHKQACLLNSALAALGVAGEIILAHSWGTLVALWLARIRPVRGLVLLSGYYFPSPRMDVMAAALPATPGVGDLWRWTIGPLLGHLLIWPALQKIFSPAPVSAQFEARFPVGLALRPRSLKSSATESVLMIPTAYLLSRYYATIDAPTVVLAGEDDEIVDVSQACRLSDVMPNASLVTVSGAGHMIHHTHPHEVVAGLEMISQHQT